MGAIHPDIAVLEKRFRGIVPKALDSAAKTFAAILKSDCSTKFGFNKAKVHNNPVKQLLQQRGVQYPEFSTGTQTSAMLSTPATANSAIAWQPNFNWITPSNMVVGPSTTSPQIMHVPYQLQFNNPFVRPISEEDDLCSPLPPKKRKM
ncbi:uncharacterized protein LOC117341272 [Pecten maximus]|uniref:uncharacterized protein LOC117341272 n=1 Tax=Pecten maximus TaxID=6579 RepID=UPI001458F8A7|nr:uncharacterized protein LOC117341272 [Pecten maximus]